MARVHKLTPTVPYPNAQTVMLGAGSGAANNLSSVDTDKPVKLVADSRYDLCAVGDEIEGTIVAVEQATQAGFSIGGVAKYKSGQMMFATADGLQGTPGTGALAVGNIVVAGTAVAKGTALTTYPKVCVATTPANVVHKWRVVALSDTNSGAVGQRVTIERV
jgi:hypothetical protein